MMKARFFLPVASIILVGCVRGPLTLVEEERVGTSVWGGLAGRLSSGAAPAFDGDVFYFGTRSGHVVAIDSSGSRRWNAKLGASVGMRPLVTGGRVYAGTSEGLFTALSAADGKALWKVEVTGGVLGEPVKVGDDVIAFGANDGYLYAVSTVDGKVKWRYRSALPDRITIQSFAAPAIRSDRVYAAFSDGTVAAVRAHDGGEIWRRTIPAKERFPDVVAPLFFSGERLLAAQYYGTLQTFLPDGNAGWSIPLGGSAASPLSLDGRLIVGASNNRILSVDAESGEIQWSQEVGRMVTWSGLAEFDRFVAAGTFEGVLYLVDKVNGSLVWRYDVGAPVVGPPISAKGRLWVLNGRGEFFGFEIRKG